MNKQPVHYLQTDKRWSSQPYRVKGENTTIGDSGCGPTAAACIIQTMTGKTFTPVDACDWSVAHGYKAYGNGTYYAYFEPQFAEFGITCKMLNWTKTYGKPDHPNHKKIFDMLKEGYYAIALMGKGLWTGSGHFVALWWEDDKVRIVDPASTKDNRLNGDIRTFCSQATYYWWIDAREFNKNGIKPIVPTEEETMDQNAFNKMFDIAMARYRGSLQDNDSSEWSKKARKFVNGAGIMSGAGSINGNPNMMWEDMLTREQAAALFYRFAELIRSGYFSSNDAAKLFEELAAM